MQQHRFRLVALMMGQGQNARATFLARFFQRCVPRLPGCVLAFPLYLHPADFAGHVQIRAHPGDEIRVPAGGFPQTVIHVGRGQEKAFLGGQFMQRLQQRHRIRPAGHRGCHAARTPRILPGSGNRFQQKNPIVHTALLYP